MEPLAHCTRLSTLVLRIVFPKSNSWQDFITTLYNIVLHISSNRLQHLRLTFDFTPSNNTPLEFPPKDSVLGNIALEPIHDTVKSSHFDPLLDATVSFSNPIHNQYMTRDIALTEGELATELRLLLQPWDKRGILTITDFRGCPLRADLGESTKIKDITPEDIFPYSWFEEVGDETSHVEHVECTGHAEEDEVRKGLEE